ncbi:MAG: antibiotic biosynthesis monooxygenase [Acidaminococcales bacterium]|jgi:quinol monooxygenase YgiN|nr:antibiotic biosynthesis monooxygenase [Acidaminococcales bacterium]
MVIVLAKIPVKPERQTEFLRHARVMIDATRREKGNVSYTLYKNTEDEREFIYVEEWADEEAFDAHLKTRHFSDFKAAEKELLAAAGSVKVYKAAEA